MKDNKMKQRLIGAAVLILLVVIFFPLLFDEPRESSIVDTNIPAQPKTGFNSKVTPLDEPPPIPQTPVIADESPATIVEQDAAEVPAEINPDAQNVTEVPAEINPDTEDGPSVIAEDAESVPVTEPAASAELAIPDQPPETDTSTSDDIAKEMDNSAGERQAVSAWVIQLGSFANEQNALKLRDQLRDKGYTTFVEAVDARGAKVFRVRIGPELERAQAEAIRDKLEQELKITSRSDPRAP